MLDLRAYACKIDTKLDHGCHNLFFSALINIVSYYKILYEPKFEHFKPNDYQDISISNSDKMYNQHFVDQIFSCHSFFVFPPNYIKFGNAKNTRFCSSKYTLMNK